MDDKKIRSMIYYWVIANIVSPCLISSSGIITINNSYYMGPIFFIIVQLLNLIYYYNYKKISIITIFMNIISFIFMGQFSIFYFMFSLIRILNL